MKHQPEPIALKEKRLMDLRVKKAFEKTDAYDKEINELQTSLDALFWGAKK